MAEAAPAEAAGHELTAGTEAHGGAEPHAGPMAFGFASAGFIVAAAMAALILVMIWKKVPGLITGGLDASIAEIRKQLDEAKALRAEADALRKEYADKIANAEKDAAAMLEHARHEAEAIVAKAEADTTTMIARREKMAEDKIAAAERGAIADLRAKAAGAATKAARGLIAQNHGAAADKVLVDQVIGGI
jgi:F-type H+-transporting ATPase subunit b